ncbi:MAG: hypothetical protein PHS79_02215 [Patescibacteria group bacterium]|nr:hypothetical protein [Patescibacteria group bacterium]
MRTVAICSSKKYKDQLHQFALELEKLGAVVFEPNFKEPLPEYYKAESDHITKVIFKGLTLEHFDWIRKADVCFIFNQDDYVGTSVTMEMAYASALSKAIYALSEKTGEPCRDSLIDKVATTPEELIKLL